MNDGTDIERGEIRQFHMIQNEIEETFDEDTFLLLVKRTRDGASEESCAWRKYLPEAPDVHRLCTNEELEELNFRFQEQTNTVLVVRTVTVVVVVVVAVLIIVGERMIFGVDEKVAASVLKLLFLLLPKEIAIDRTEIGRAPVGGERGHDRSEECEEKRMAKGVKR